MGELAASIAHEVNQPLCAILNDANSGRRILAASEVDVEEARETFEDIAISAKRASDVIDHIRQLLAKHATMHRPLDMNELLRESLDLAKSNLDEPGLSGLDLQRELDAHGIFLPIVFITGHGDIPMSVKAMKAGAVDFLQKPFDDSALLAAVREAIDRNARDRQQQSELADARGLIESLTPREREILAMVVGGMLNKHIAHRLQIKEGTVKAHRSHIMDKLHVTSVAELTILADRAGVERISR